MKHSLLLTLTLASPSAFALEAACEPIVAASERTAAQHARHSVADDADGTRMEAIVLDGAFYVSVDGSWRRMPVDLRATERRINAGMRDGSIALSGCRAEGRATVDGIQTSVFAYRVALRGQIQDEARLFVGDDGLVHALSSGGHKVRYRYSGVTAPKL
ncbi:hypothetical protein ACQQ2N_13995 [Dokdonella sp. MW10]|uniref:hypothetical protein n=1 Tax=Dokdonella sp. MW10 TaxID=2992926 RepID=UPI003F7E0074